MFLTERAHLEDQQLHSRYGAPVPEISRFYGIVIAIFYAEELHPGRAHFHATYVGRDVSIDIDTLEILAGSLPANGLKLVRRWARLHQHELLEDWRRARRGEPLEPIDPLP